VSRFSFPAADLDSDGPAYRSRFARIACWALAAATLGCSGPPGAASKLGEDLGTFHVTANQLTNDCGAGALGATASFGFDVELQRDYTQLFWNGQSGRLESGYGFDFAAVVRVPLATTGAAMPSCVIERDDHISGTLEGDQALTATLSYGFASDPNRPCTLDAEARAGLPDLPCSMNYALRGQRTRAPAGLSAPVAPTEETSAPETSPPESSAPTETSALGVAPPEPPSSTPPRGFGP